MSGVVYFARCPEHGLHGRRDTCFECGGPVEQVGMVPLADVLPLREAAHDVLNEAEGGTRYNLSFDKALARLAQVLTPDSLTDEARELLALPQRKDSP